jgi:hypothetical protein
MFREIPAVIERTERRVRRATRANRAMFGNEGEVEGFRRGECVARSQLMGRKHSANEEHNGTDCGRKAVAQERSDTLGLMKCKPRE